MSRVIFFSKSKRTTQATRHMMLAFRRHPEVERAVHIHPGKMAQFVGESLGDRWVRWWIRRIRPDITLVNQVDVEVPWLEMSGEHGFTACVYHDYTSPISDEVVEVGKRVDMFYLANEHQVEAYRDRGVDPIKVRFRGCSKDNHYPVDSVWRSLWKADVAFIGKPRSNVRPKIIRAVDRAFDLKIFGTGWSEYGLEPARRRVRAKGYRKICRGSRIMLGINDGADHVQTMEDIRSLRGYTSNRTRVTLGCGGFVLTNYNEGLEEYFTPGVHLDVYRTIDECLEKIAHYLEHDEERERIARQGCEHVHENMTFDHFVDEVVEDAAAWRAEAERVGSSSRDDS